MPRVGSAARPLERVGKYPIRHGKIPRNCCGFGPIALNGNLRVVCLHGYKLGHAGCKLDFCNVARGLTLHGGFDHIYYGLFGRASPGALLDGSDDFSGKRCHNIDSGPRHERRVRPFDLAGYGDRSGLRNSGGSGLFAQCTPPEKFRLRSAETRNEGEGGLSGFS